MSKKTRFSIVKKTIAFLGLFFSIICFPLAGMGTYYMVSEGYYIANPQSIKEKQLDAYLGELGRKILYTYYRMGKAEADEVTDGVSINYAVLNSNERWLWDDVETDVEWSNTYSYSSIDPSYYFYGMEDMVIKIQVPEEKLYPDYVALVCFVANHAGTLKVLLPFFILLSVATGTWCLVYLVCGAGWNAEKEKQTGGALGFVPLEVLLAFFVAMVLGIIRIPPVDFYRYPVLEKGILGFVVIGLLSCIIAISIAARVKNNTLWKHSILGQTCRVVIGLVKVLWGILKRIPLIWKSVVIAVLLTSFELWALLTVYQYIPKGLYVQRVFLGVFLLWVLEKILLMIIGFFSLQRLKELQLAGKELAEGNSEYKVDTAFMFGEFKEHALHLNSISEGVTKAVEERMKSEHFKTELITNVSHDIKTPLTSIINYSDLICKEETDNPNIKEYADVLYRQSCRMKKLIEDLMEASKASTGNIEVKLEPCDVGVLLTQASGEFEQRIFEKNMDLISKQPEKPVLILADSKLLWRVFDNLMTNICKYSQRGTRVYLAVEEKDNNAIISFKNISEYPLDISAEELMERFVRGDRSRHTEGNGLGLNIAKSLTELQKGTLELSVDGDLFKVILTFPVIQEEKE